MFKFRPPFTYCCEIPRICLRITSLQNLQIWVVKARGRENDMINVCHGMTRFQILKRVSNLAKCFTQYFKQYFLLFIRILNDSNSDAGRLRNAWKHFLFKFWSWMLRWKQLYIYRGNYSSRNIGWLVMGLRLIVCRVWKGSILRRGSFYLYLVRVFTSFWENYEKLRTARPMSSTEDWTLLLSSTSLRAGHLSHFWGFCPRKRSNIKQ